MVLVCGEIEFCKSFKVSGSLGLNLSDASGSGYYGNFQQLGKTNIHVNRNVIFPYVASKHSNLAYSFPIPVSIFLQL